MGELTTEDVRDFTNGRLQADPAGTGQVTQMLNAAVSVVRRDAGWHVCPVHTDETVTLDGPDSRILYLPTLKLRQLISVEENDTALDLTKLRWTSGPVASQTPEVATQQATVRKRSGGWWNCEYQSIVVHMTHGFTEAEASEWRRAVLTMVDQMSLVPVGGFSGFSQAALKSKRIDDTAYAFDNSYVMMAEDMLYSVDSMLSRFRLPRVEFV